MKRPFLYYELDTFYSNYRTVVKTPSLYDQLRGESIDLDECQGVRYVKDLLPDLSVYKAFSKVDLSSLAEDTPLSPCGILSKYVFTDRFGLYDKKER